MSTASWQNLVWRGSTEWSDFLILSKPTTILSPEYSSFEDCITKDMLDAFSPLSEIIFRILLLFR